MTHEQVNQQQQALWLAMYNAGVNAPGTLGGGQVSP